MTSGPTLLRNSDGRSRALPHTSHTSTGSVQLPEGNNGMGVTYCGPASGGLTGTVTAHRTEDRRYGYLEGNADWRSVSRISSEVWANEEVSVLSTRRRYLQNVNEIMPQWKDLVCCLSFFLWLLTHVFQLWNFSTDFDFISYWKSTVNVISKS